jgi:hypothetical protein
MSLAPRFLAHDSVENGSGAAVDREFEEIGHSGGKITFRVVTDETGRRGYQVSISGNRPVPMVLIAVYALPQGCPLRSSISAG